MEEPRPTGAAEFRFGLWTVGRQARDRFGDATRLPRDPAAELGVRS
jgi:hypothetical protein